MQILFFALSIILLFSLFLYFIPLNLYITAVFSGTELGILELVVMRIRRIPPRPIVFALITATKAGVEVTTAELESHYLAGGNINNVVRSLIMAKQKSLDLTFKQAAAMDLTGKNPVHAVEKKHLESKNGVETIRKALVYKVENELDEFQVRDLASYVEKMNLK